MTEKPLTEQTPVEIDTVLADAYGKRQSAQVDLSLAADQIKRYVMPSNVPWHMRDGWRFEGSLDEAVAAAKAKVQSYEVSSVERAEQAIAKARAAIHAAEAVIAPRHEEFRRRGGWTRAYLAVTNGGGHVHKSMDCHSCYSNRWDERTGEFKPGTQFAWLPEYSGHDESEIVTAAGERACTVCYPSAPVEDLNRPTTIFSQDEKDKAAAREEREAKRAEREAAKVTLTVYDSHYDGTNTRPKTVTWKTTRALQNDLGALVRSYCGAYAMTNGFRLEFQAWSTGGGPRVPVNREEGLHNIRVMAEALAARGVDTEALIAKAVKRAKKEGHTRWDGVLG